MLLILLLLLLPEDAAIVMLTVPIEANVEADPDIDMAAPSRVLSVSPAPTSVSGSDVPVASPKVEEIGEIEIFPG